jgi:hypothetical protein
MCDPGTAALILTAISGTTEAVNVNQARRRQDREAAEGIRRQGRLSSQADVRVGEQIEDIATSTGESERAEALEGFLNALRTSKESTEGALDPIAAANPRFAERVTGGKERITSAGTARAGRLSRIDPAIFQRMNEAGRIGRTAGDLGELRRQSSAEEFLTQLRVAAERPNEFISLLTSIGKGVGSVWALKPSVPKKDTFSRLFKQGSIIDAPTTASPFTPGLV